MPQREPRVVVFPSKYVTGWDGGALQGVELFALQDVSDALEKTYNTDAHFAPYYMVGETQMPRLRQKALNWLREQGANVLFNILVVDVDCPEAHQENQEADGEWRHNQFALLKDTPWWDNAGFYETRGGYRLLWQLQEPLKPEQYIAYLLGFVEELASYGIQADKLQDWNRIYRLPYVNRQGQQQDGALDLDDMGVLDWELQAFDTNTGFIQQLDGIEKVNQPFVAPEHIETGSRNKTLARLAGQLRRQGLSEQEMIPVLLIANENRCNPPLGEDEVASIAKSICKYDAGANHSQEDIEQQIASGDMFRLGSEMEIAEATCRKLEDKLGPSMVYDRSELWLYIPKEGTWKTVHPEIVRNVVGTFDGAPIVRGVNAEGELKTTPLKVGHRLRTNVSECVFDARSHRGFFDCAMPGLTFANVFVSADSNGPKQQAFNHKQRSTVGLPFDYKEKQTPHDFIKALNQCWRDDKDKEQKILLLQQFVGVCLLGLATKFQRALILLGAGANGKSTIQSIVSALFEGKLIGAIPPQDMEQEYRRAMLADVRLNVVNELPEADILMSEAVKAMISGDRMVGRHIRQAPFEFVPKAGHIFSANALPSVRDMSHGFWRRWLVLDFNRAFLPEEQDRYLAQRIIQNERPAIASWAIEGAKDALNKGTFDIPTSSEQALQKWRSETDQVSAFITEYNDGQQDPAPAASALYNAYCLWASQNGHRQVSATKFGRRLHGLGIEKKKTKAANIYVLNPENAGKLLN